MGQSMTKLTPEDQDRLIYLDGPELMTLKPLEEQLYKFYFNLQVLAIQCEKESPPEDVAAYGKFDYASTLRLFKSLALARRENEAMKEKLLEVDSILQWVIACHAKTDEDGKEIICDCRHCTMTRNFRRRNAALLGKEG